MSNTVAKAIIDKWAATPAVNDLMDSSNVYNGIYTDNKETYPFATISFPGSSFNFRTTSDGCIAEDETVRIALYYTEDVGDYDAMQALTLAIRGAYNKFEAELDNSEGGISDGIIESVQEIQDEEDGTWTKVIDLGIKVTRNV